MSARWYIDPIGGVDFVIETVPDGAQFVGDKLANHGKDGGHLFGGADEIDGDRLGIDYSPVNYAPDVAPPQVTNISELTAHLAGIDTALITGNVQLPTFNISGSQSISTPGVYFVNATDNPTVITIPNANTLVGQTFQIAKTDGANDVDVTTTGGTDPIGGATTQTIGLVDTSIKVIDNGAVGGYEIIQDSRAVGAAITGVGTVGQIPKFTAAQVIGDSILSESGSVVFNTGLFRADTGSALNPAYSFTADEDTGMARIGVNLLRLVAGGDAPLEVSPDTVTIDGDNGLLISQPQIFSADTALDITSIWNAVGDTFTAVLMDITDTASAAASLLMDLQVGSSSQFSVSKTGNLVAGTYNGVTVEGHASRHQDGNADELPVDTLAEAAAPGNDQTQVLAPNGSGGVSWVNKTTSASYEWAEGPSKPAENEISGTDTRVWELGSGDDIVLNFQLPEDIDLASVDPVLEVTLATALEDDGATNGTVNFQLTARYVADTELFSKTLDETLTPDGGQPTIIDTLAEMNTITFTLDRTAMAAGDAVTLRLENLGTGSFVGDVGAIRNSKLTYRVK